MNRFLAQMHRVPPVPSVSFCTPELLPIPSFPSKFLIL
jgi:hypothetical protein